jgi:hypothetical protein
MIVSTETGGLGNRIKSWVSAMRLDPDCRVYWERTPNMPASFEDLFTNDSAVAVVPPEARIHKSWRLEVLPEDEPHLPAGFATVGGGAHPLVRGVGKLWWKARGRPDDRYRFMVFPKQHSRRSSRADARHIDLEYARIPEHFRRVYCERFAAIGVQPAILARVDAFATEHLDRDVIGVQVRTWRDDPRRERKYHRPSVKRLFALMDAVDPQRRFFVVSDSDDTAVTLAARYGAERVLTYPRATSCDGSWQSAEGLIEDLIDMLVLARVERLFASYLSTFSETAWWFGGTRAAVEVF